MFVKKRERRQVYLIRTWIEPILESIHYRLYKVEPISTIILKHINLRSQKEGKDLGRIGTALL